MKLPVIASSLILGVGLMGAAVAQAEQSMDQKQQLTEQASTSVVATQSKTTPIFYGTDGALPFSKAVRAGNTLYLSGELGMKDGKVVEGGVRQETEQALDNINKTLLSYGYQSSDLVKCMVMLTDMEDFAEFNEGYKAKLAKPYPVRSAFAVADLALGAKVEIECMAVK
ncbi:RidA family protein [Psychrobacter phenylpyruvicus]|uniref:Enamine/imine deaminase n=1 Tax=Psychrobacter phenylpyruvicus TaxID=29432 RepID=A0A379LKI3_9GAMM|nr:Rid family hydrolase [Psychrobacter phenylpyruvicus]SUD91096.1 Enamine/imine deaminase [Psychrobacter phenylpyruvicus]